MKMKILIATFTFFPNKDGIAEASAAVTKAFLSQGWDVDIATSVTDPCRESLNWDGAVIHEFSISGSTYFRDPFVGELKSYRDFLLAGTWDVIVFQSYFWPLYLALDLLPRLPSKKVFVSHGCGAFIYFKTARFPYGVVRFLSDFWQSLRLFFWGRYMDRLVFYSRKQDWRAFFDVRLANWINHSGISIIPNGVQQEPAPFPQGHFRNKFNIPPASVFLLCVANYSLRKDQGFAVRSFRKAKIPNSILVFIGSEFNDASCHFQKEDSCNASAKNQGKVLWLEKVDRDETLQAIGESDICILSARHEGQPFFLLEAMAQERPWIARNAGCIRDLPGGQVVFSVEEMASVMRGLAFDSKERWRLGQEGCRAAKTIFSRRQYAENYTSLIRELFSQ